MIMKNTKKNKAINIKDGFKIFNRMTLTPNELFLHEMPSKNIKRGIKIFGINNVYVTTDIIEGQNVYILPENFKFWKIEVCQKNKDIISKAMSLLAKKRWQKTTKKKRSQHARKMALAMHRKAGHNIKK